MTSRLESKIVASGMIVRSRRAAFVVGIAIAVAAVPAAHGRAEPAPSDPVSPADADAPTTLEVDVRPVRETVAAPSAAAGGSPAATTGADAWHAAGITGAGVRIGVIDFFDVNLYWDESVLGPRPVAGVTARCFERGADCTGEFFDGFDETGENHGVAVVEMIRAMAPDAEILIGQATTIADYTMLVDWFASQGVDIVNRSLGSRYDGPGDGRGPLDDVAAAAVGKGMTWINSAGNGGEDKYYRHPVRLVAGNVAFGPDGDDRFLEAKGCLSLAGMRWANDWDRPAWERTDYDLYVWESPTGDPASGSIVARSELRQTAGAAPLEYISGSRCPDAGRTLYLEVRWVRGDIAGDVIEILDYENGFAEHTGAAYSATVPIVDSDVDGVVAVGAIDPPDSGTIAAYSSQGPTNDGRIAPAVTAPSGFRSVIYGGRFSGTSAAAAVVAGAAALFLDGEVTVGGIALGNLVRHSTIDRGAPGPDNVYGHGQLVLPPPPPAAPAATPSRYLPLPAPTRLLDTRPDTAVGPTALLGRTRPGEIRSLPIADLYGVPADVTSVAVNLTSVRSERRGFVQALPLWESTLGGFSTLNSDDAQQVRANFAIVPIAADGTISFYSTAATDLVVDLLGWFEPSEGEARGGRFVQLPTAQRLVDTRTGDAPAVGSGTTVPVPGLADVPSTDVDAIVVTVTAVDPTTRGWLQAFPADQPELVGTTSTVNFGPGDNVAGTAIVPIGATGAAVRTFFSTGGAGHVIVDAVGYITSESAPASEDGHYVAVRPGRAFDSRTDGGRLPSGGSRLVSATTVGVPTDASAVSWNVTIVDADRRGHARGWAADGELPPTSLLNWVRPRETRAAAAVTATSGGAAWFRIQDGRPDGVTPLGHLLADVFGYFT
jgi:hypothetical protein